MASRAFNLASLRGLARNGLVSGVAANLMAIGVQMVIQLLSVPVLMLAYGVDGFGIWLLLATIPTYFIMSDLGLVTAAANEMAIRWGRGDEKGILTLFQSVWTCMVAIAVLISAAAAAIVLLTGPIKGLWPEELAPHLWVIPILVAYAAMYQISNIFVAGFRGTGLYALGTVLCDTPTLLEGLAMLATAILTHDMTLAAAVMLAIRTIAAPLIYLALRRYRPFFKVGSGAMDWHEIRTLLPSALGVLTIPASIAISLQGTVIVIGALLGPASVALFASVRTASRFLLAFGAMVVRAIIPELAAAHGRGDAEAKARYWKLFQRARWLILIPAVILFALLGSWLVELWSLGKLEPSHVLVAIMGLGLLPHGIWYLDFFMLTATHQHISLTRPILLLIVAGLGLTFAAVWFGGLIGAALSVMFTDVIIAWLVHRTAVRKLVL